jgi:4-hydroxythreonine-4-phosphate dehydrogenase
MSKTSIRKAGFKEIGHTELLQTYAGVSKLQMGFLGSAFHVVLATGHVPLKEVSAALTPAKLRSAFGYAHEIQKAVKSARGRKGVSIYVLGLNPHAGEEGLLGSEESRVVRPAIQTAKRHGIVISGPLVPDAAFVPGNLPHGSIVVALYHDQGLIPFKMAHGYDEGVHLTLGLPFVRTSVDHGTAKDIFGQNKARHGSMLSALRWCMLLVKERENGEN